MRVWLWAVVIAASGCSVFVGDDTAGDESGIAVDQTADRGGFADMDTGLSFDYFTPETDDRLLLVTVAANNDFNPPDVSYGGVPLMLIDSVAGELVRLDMLFLTAPATGSNTLSIDYGFNREVIVGVLSLSGADQIAPIRDDHNESGTSNTVELAIPSESGDLLCVSFVTDQAAGAITLGDSLDEQWKATGGGMFGIGATRPGGPDGSVSGALDDPLDWLAAGVSIRPAN